MATESPMRMVESSGAPNWPSSKDAVILGSPLKNIALEDWRLLLKGQKFYGDQRDVVPNRSGSAPPSMEGSFAAIGSLLAQQSTNLNSSLASLSSIIENSDSEEQLRSDPAYFSYYFSNVNLNPRLPPPLISQKNQHLACYMGGFGNKWRATSVDDSGNGPLHFSRSSLFTHKEEPEDDRSPIQASDQWTETNSTSPEEDSASLTCRHKSLVDLIQEDFPRTPSPVYNQSRSSSLTTTEEFDHDVHAISSNFSSIDISKVTESTIGSADVGMDMSALDANAISLISSKSSLENSAKCSPCPNQIGIFSAAQIDERSKQRPGWEDDASSGVPHPVVSRAESRMRKKQAEQFCGKNMPQKQQGFIHRAEGIQSPIVSQGMKHSHSVMEKLTNAHLKFSSTEAQTSLPTPGLTSPLYATSAAYLTPGNAFYPNFPPSGLYAPQYNVGGYALSSPLIPPFMTGYSSLGTVGPFDSTSVSNFSSRTSGISMGEGISHAGDLQHLYGQHGLMVQPFQIQYLQHPFGNMYVASLQQRLQAATGIYGEQANSFMQKEPTVAAYMADQKTHPSISGSLGIPHPGKVGSTGYYGSSPSLGGMSHFSPSLLSSPVLPSSPVGGTSYLNWRNEMGFPQHSSRNAGSYFGWQGRRGANSFHDSKIHSFLEELKSKNAGKFELSDIAGRIVEFSVDQHGSRFIQQKLEQCGVEEKESVFREVLPHCSRLMADVFGNYVIQKFFEHGSPEQRKELAGQLVGHMLSLSLQMYGCRVIQKAFEVIDIDQKAQLACELDGHVMTCVRDQNGNHVIQKCIECVPIKNIGFIISAFHGQVATLSTHPYGCRVIQRVLENCSDEMQSQCIMDEILDAACVLAQDQYGNYVIQHVLEKGKSHERSHIISKFTGKVVELCQHKYASNVIEKCLEYGDSAERELLIGEIIGQSNGNDNLLSMMKDQFANYVVQKILDVSNDRQREVLLNCIRVNLDALKKYTYGKHIAARFEQLIGEEREASDN